MRLSITTSVWLLLVAAGLQLAAASSSSAEQSPSNSLPAGCVVDALAQRPPKSGLIHTKSGRLFQALGQDFIDDTTWRKAESIVICEGPSDHTAKPMPRYHLRNVPRGEELVVVEGAASGSNQEPSRNLSGVGR